ncbi:MAG: fumarylacetoacetate hydrolase family protein [Pseudomonadota bacterium]
MALSPEQIERAAELLAAARRDVKVIGGLPEDCRPGNLEEAYAIRDSLVAKTGWPISGWFCACTNRDIQELLGLAEPYYACLLKPFIRPSPCQLLSIEFPPMVLECEVAFTLGADLPPRDQPYSREEVEAAVATAHPAIEVVAGHLREWPSQDVFSVIADNGTDGALVYGAGIAGWREIDLVALSVRLLVNGEQVRHGSGANVLGDPMTALVWLANAGVEGGLKAGQIHNTGTTTPIYWVGPGDHAVADFGPLGEAELEVL